MSGFNAFCSDVALNGAMAVLFVLSNANDDAAERISTFSAASLRMNW